MAIKFCGKPNLIIDFNCLRFKKIQTYYYAKMFKYNLHDTSLVLLLKLKELKLTNLANFI